MILHYLHVKVSSKGNEYKENWYDEPSCYPGCKMRLKVVKLHPTQNADFNWKWIFVVRCSMSTLFAVYILRKRRMPRTVLNAHASSTMMDILRWGDSWTVCGVWTWRLETASVWGRMQVEIMRANMWTAIRRTVHTANANNRPWKLDPVSTLWNLFSIFLTYCWYVFINLDLYHGHHGETCQ